MNIEPNSCLIVVDVQNDFVTGSLAVPGAEHALQKCNYYIRRFTLDGYPIIFTQDFHKRDHPSFKEQGGRWPPHCVEGTLGQQQARGLDHPADVITILKGYDEEAYSGFEGTPLQLFYKYHHIEHAYICGLATDFCVRATALDSVKLAKTTVLLHACAGVTPATTSKALDDMIEAGVVCTI